MHSSELVDNLNIIFEKERSDNINEVSTFNLLSIGNVTILDYPNGDTLIEYFLTLDNDIVGKRIAIEFLQEIVITSKEERWGTNYYGKSQLGFYALVKLGFIDEAVSALNKREWGFELLHLLLIEMVMAKIFDLQHLKIVSKIVDMQANKSFTPISTRLTRLKAVIVDAKFDLLKSQIRKTNFEINQDKKAVSEKISRYGFSQRYNELLESIDLFINTETSNVVNAGMINNLRTFIGDLLKDIANKIAEKEQNPIPMKGSRSEMGSIRAYLKDRLELSDHDNKFIDAFIVILHTEGGHSFTSEKEYFRLSKNIAIEITLFILTKFEKKYG